MEKCNPLSEDVYLYRRVKKNYSPRTDYFRDQTAIIHSMPFRRLKHKTQVFFSPQNDHVCTRIEHVLHVATIAATICKGLNLSGKGWNLNEELAYAIGLGHDVGHAPFGHSGETALNDLLGKRNPFFHEINSYRVIEYLANEGTGLNCTYAVKDGIICHCGEKFEQEFAPRQEYIDLDKIKEKIYYPSTYEGCIVRISDKVAYFGRDIEDAYLAKFIKKDDLPSEILKYLGKTNGDIIDTLVNDIIRNSANNDKIGFSKEKHSLINILKDFNYSKIYSHPRIQKWRNYGERIIKSLFEYLLEIYEENGFTISKYYKNSNSKLDEVFGNYLKKMKKFYLQEETSPKQIVADYIAGMTDEYTLRCMKYLSIPDPIEF